MFTRALLSALLDSVELKFPELLKLDQVMHDAGHNILIWEYVKRNKLKMNDEGAGGRLKQNLKSDVRNRVSEALSQSTELAKEQRLTEWRYLRLFAACSTGTAVGVMAGVTLLRSPCTDSYVDLSHPRGLGALRAMGCWLHEDIGYQAYRARGWIK